MRVDLFDYDLPADRIAQAPHARGTSRLLTLDRASGLIPYVLVFAASGFIYIAVSDLMPQMQRRSTIRESVPQVLLIGLGVVIVLFLTHGH